MDVGGAAGQQGLGAVWKKEIILESICKKGARVHVHNGCALPLYIGVFLRQFDITGARLIETRLSVLISIIFAQ